MAPRVIRIARAERPVDWAGRLITEKEFHRTVAAFLRARGFRVYHTRYSLGSDPGYPDITAVGHGTVLWLELKNERGRVTQAQEDWIVELQMAGQHARVVRPSDWDDLVRLVDGIVQRNATTEERR